MVSKRLTNSFAVTANVTASTMQAETVPIRSLVREPDATWNESKVGNDGSDDIQHHIHGISGRVVHKAMGLRERLMQRGGVRCAGRESAS